MSKVQHVPDGWSNNIFDEIVDITRLAGYEYSEYWKEDPEGQIITLRGYNIGKNIIIDRDFVRISNKLSMRLKRSRLNKGDIVFPCVGSIGNAVVIKENDLYHINQNIAKITPREVVSSDFLVQFLMSKLCEKEIMRFNASSSQPNVLVGSLRKFRILLPPLPEQEKIASILSAWDKAIEKVEKLIEAKKKLKKGLMQQLLTGEKRFKEFEGEDWKAHKIKDCCDILDNKRVPLNETQRRTMNGNVPYYGANGVVDFIDDFLFNEELILVAEDGGHFDEFQTRPIAYKIAGKSWVNNHAHILRAKSGFNQNFIFYCLEHKNIIKYLNGGTRAKLNKEELKKIPLNIPVNRKEQDKIVQTLALTDSEDEKLNEVYEQIKVTKKGLMQKLLTGKIRVKI